MNDWLPTFAIGAVMATTGFLVGLVYFSLLRRSVSTLAAGGGTLHVLALLIGRFALAVCFLLWAVRFGAAALVFAAAGIVVARTILARE